MNVLRINIRIVFYVFFSTFARLPQRQLKTFNHLRFLFVLLSRDWFRPNSKHLIISASSYFLLEIGTGPTQNIKSSRLLLRSSFEGLVQAQLEASHHLCFFVFPSQDWNRANSKHLIISASYSFFFRGTGSGPTRSISSSLLLRISFSRLEQGQLKTFNHLCFLFVLLRESGTRSTQKI